MAHILHADLSKASIEELQQELQYLYATRIPAIIRGLNQCLMSVLNRNNPDLPLWMSNSDLTDACDRFQAIVEEIQHRSEI